MIEESELIQLLKPAGSAEAKDHVPDFEKDLARLINQYSMEYGSDTPDFILAEYMAGCLANFNRTVRQRTKYYAQ